MNIYLSSTYGSTYHLSTIKFSLYTKANPSWQIFRLLIKVVPTLKHSNCTSLSSFHFHCSKQYWSDTQRNVLFYCVLTLIKLKVVDIYSGWQGCIFTQNLAIKLSGIPTIATSKVI